jgi:hypothetical protein
MIPLCVLICISLQLRGLRLGAKLISLSTSRMAPLCALFRGTGNLRRKGPIAFLPYPIYRVAFFDSSRFKQLFSSKRLGRLRGVELITHMLMCRRLRLLTFLLGIAFFCAQFTRHWLGRQRRLLLSIRLLTGDPAIICCCCLHNKI